MWVHLQKAGPFRGLARLLISLALVSTLQLHVIIKPRFRLCNIEFKWRLFAWEEVAYERI